MIEELAKLIPPSMLGVSGKAFYSGRAAFDKPSPIYVLGLNPGGAPESMQDETVGSHTDAVLRSLPAMWSAYCDESWKGRRPGSSGMQPRVIHMAQRLGIDPRRMPASNVVFSRSAREGTFAGTMVDGAELAWPFHKRAIEMLGARVVICFGKTAGKFVAAKLNASTPAGAFVEDNDRRWPSVALRAQSGMAVATLTHPSIADWTNSRTDPTPMIQQLMAT